MMREKRRYILVESANEIDENSRKDFEFYFYSALLHSIGEINYFKANPKIIKYVDRKGFVLKCNLVMYKETLNALTFIKQLNKKDTAFYTINASGTVKALAKQKQ